MGTRRKIATAAASIAGTTLAAGALVRARQRALNAGKGALEDLMPSVLEHAPEPEMAGFDAAHAPGHRHLPLARWARRRQTPQVGAPRPFAKHRHGLRHPGRG
jgi:hypothetical protein